MGLLIYAFLTPVGPKRWKMLLFGCYSSLSGSITCFCGFEAYYLAYSRTFNHYFQTGTKKKEIILVFG
jgi:hypothetical protein